MDNLIYNHLEKYKYQYIKKIEKILNLNYIHIK